MRQALMLIHRWLGLALFAYVVALSLSGGVLVYRNELYRHFQARPTPVVAAGAPLADAALTRAAEAAHPGFTAVDLGRGAADEAARVQLVRGAQARMRLFDPYSGEDLGEALPLGYRATRFLVDLHTDLLLGYRGRPLNGWLALAFTVAVVTGWIVWAVFPLGRRKRKRAPDTPNTLRTVHRLVGLWLGVFTLMWAVTGAHLSLPGMANTVIDYLEPLDAADPEERTGDKVAYWLSYAHFGRFGGRIPGCDRAQRLRRDAEGGLGWRRPCPGPARGHRRRHLDRAELTEAAAA